MTTADPLFCDRCRCTLHSGEGNFYVVKIEAMADPSPPTVDEPPEDIAGEIERLIEQVEQHSERELMDQVHRRLTLHLCRPCYQDWIENPTGS